MGINENWRYADYSFYESDKAKIVNCVKDACNALAPKLGKKEVNTEYDKSLAAGKTNGRRLRALVGAIRATFSIWNAPFDILADPALCLDEVDSAPFACDLGNQAYAEWPAGVFYFELPGASPAKTLRFPGWPPLMPTSRRAPAGPAPSSSQRRRRPGDGKPLPPVSGLIPG